MSTVTVPVPVNSRLLALRTSCTLAASQFRTELDANKLEVFFKIGRRIRSWITQYGNSQETWDVIRHHFLTSMRWSRLEPKCRACLRMYDVMDQSLPTMRRMVSRIIPRIGVVNFMRPFHPAVPPAISRQMVDWVINADFQIYPSTYVTHLRKLMSRAIRSGTMTAADRDLAMSYDRHGMVIKVSLGDRAFLGRVFGGKAVPPHMAASAILRSLRQVNERSSDRLLTMVRKSDRPDELIARLILKGMNAR